ncbi:MAG: NRDE family protein, partial [Dongiaceae bacterium]
FWLRNLGHREGWVEKWELPPGLSMITAYDRNDTESRRIRSFLPRFQAAPVPDPESGDWTAWEALLGSRDYEASGGPGDAMAIVTDYGFETTSSSLIALPAASTPPRRPVWHFAAGRAGEQPFAPVNS